jgi:hypothetical protein
MKRAFYLLFAVFPLLPFAALGKNVGVFVDGSYSPGSANSAMDRVIDRRLDDAQRNMRNRDSSAEIHRVDTKRALDSVMSGINGKCGDTINLVMMGHGTDNRFSFTKQGKRVSANELLAMLRKAATECCCKINVVIFACHSGSFIDDLFKDPHVISVFTSCGQREQSYTDGTWDGDSFVDRGDWMDGFNHDWAQVERGASWVRQLEEASKTAEERMPDGFTARQHPRGYRRGEQPVRAHVERVRKSGRPRRVTRVRVHYYDPEFMRCTQEELTVPAGTELPDGLKPCDWVRFTADFRHPDSATRISGAVTRTDPPTERILAHVEGVNRRRGIVTVHTVRPKWLYCKRQRMRVDDRRRIGDGVRRCVWIEQDVTVTDPADSLRTGGSVTPTEPVFRVKAHVEGSLNHDRGTFNVHILEPSFLHCNQRKVQLPPGERNKLRGLSSCKNVALDLTWTASGNAPGRNLTTLLNRQGQRGYAADVAVHRPQTYAPLAAGEPFVPVIGVVNVGTAPAAPTVRTVIAPAEQAKTAEQRRLLLRTPNGAWISARGVESLAPAETHTVAFDSWTTDLAGEYWLGFMTMLPDDGNPANDTSSTMLSVVAGETTGNRPPLLSGPLVRPESGGVSTQFVWQVTYRDEDNDMPVMALATIDGEPRPLEPGPGDPVSGITFRCTGVLGPGEHRYVFRFDDGHGHSVETNELYGPLVR